MATRQTSNPNFDKEQTEGSRETVDRSLDYQTDRQKPGITQHSVAEERKEQEKLPPRGEGKIPRAATHERPSTSTRG